MFRVVGRLRTQLGFTRSLREPDTRCTTAAEEFELKATFRCTSCHHPLWRVCFIDMRPDKNEIIKDIVLKRRTIADIARRIGVSNDTVFRFRDDKITEEIRRRIIAEDRMADVEQSTEIINQDRVDVSNTYETLARRVEKLIAKAEQNEDDSFALAAMEGLRKVLRDIATMQGKLATNLTVSVTLAESPEWVALRHILNEVIDEVPEAREPLLQRMRHEVLSVTKEEGGAL